MKPHRALIWLILLACSMGAIVSGNMGRYPSPYVDDWSDVALRGTGVDASAAVLACVAANGRAVFREGTYTLDPNGAAAVPLPDNAVLEGAGMGLSILQMPDNETGVILLLGSDCVVRDLTLDGFDDATTAGSGMLSTEDRATYVRVEFSDFSTGCTAGNDASDGNRLIGCKFTSCTSGFVTGSASTSIEIVNCTFNGNTSAIVLNASPLGVLIHSCLFVNETTAINNATGSKVTIRGNSFLAGTTSIVVPTTANGNRNEIGENYWAFDETVTSDVVDKQCSLRGKYYGTVAPANGTWLVGEVVHNSAPGASGANATHWICSTAGTPGTWQAAYRGFATLYATATYDPASMADGTGTSKSDFVVTGAGLGATALWGAPYEIPAGVVVTASVVSTNAVRITLFNHSGGVVDLASGNWTVRVVQ